MTFSRFLRFMVSVGALNLVDRIAGIILGIVLARWLGVKGYGVYAFAMAFLALMLIPAKWGQAELLLRETAVAQVDQVKFDPHAIRRSAGILVVLLSLVLALLSAPVIGYFYASDGTMRNALYISLVFLPIYVLLEVACFGLRGGDRVIVASWLATLAPNLLTCLGMIAFFFNTVILADPLAALWLRFAATLAAMGVAWTILLRLPSGIVQAAATAPGVATLFRHGFPFMLLSASSVLMSRTDIFLLGIFNGPAEVGVYNVAFQAAVLVDFGLQISGIITTQEFARFHATGRRQELQQFARNTARFNLAIGAGVMLVLIVFGRTLLNMLFGQEFVSAYPLLVALAAGKGIALLFGEPGFILNMSGNERTTVHIFGTTAIMNLILCLVAIPLFGTMGAAIASGLSLFIWRVMAWRAVRSKVEISCAVF